MFDFDALDHLELLAEPTGDGAIARPRVDQNAYRSLGCSGLDDLERLGEEPSSASSGPAAAARLDADDLEHLHCLGLRRQPRAPIREEARGPLKLARAREKLGQTRRAADKEYYKQEIAERDAQLRAVHAAYPKIAKSLNLRVPATPRSSGRGSAIVPVDQPTHGRNSMSHERGAALANIAFQANSRGAGVKHQRLVQFASSVVDSLEKQGIQCFLQKCVVWRRSSHVELKCSVHLKYEHQSDATEQSIAQHVIQKVGRPASKHLKSEIMQQRGRIVCILLATNPLTGATIEKRKVTLLCHCFSLCMLGKSATFITRTLEECVFFMQGGEEAFDAWCILFVAALDSFTFDQLGDKGANGLPAFRHLAMNFKDIGVIALRDISSCELHNLHGVKVLPKIVKSDVGKMYCLSSVSKGAIYHNDLTNVFQYISSSSAVRVVMHPPAPEQNDLYMLLDDLYDIQALRHNRGQLGDSEATQKSLLHNDLMELVRTRTFSIAGFAVGARDAVVRVHCCYDPVTGAPCHDSQEDFEEAFSIANINFFATSAVDRIALGRFTNAAKLRKRLITGMVNQRMGLTAMSWALSRAVDPAAPVEPKLEPSMRPEDIASSEKGWQIQHKSKCKSLSGWFSSRQIYYTIPITECAAKFIDELQYEFFTDVTLLKLLDPDDSPIITAMTGLWDLLGAWGNDKLGPWRVGGSDNITYLTSWGYPREVLCQGVLGGLLLYWGCLRVFGGCRRGFVGTSRFLRASQGLSWGDTWASSMARCILRLSNLA